MNPGTRLQNRFTRVDLAALLVFAAVWIYYIITMRYGFCSIDESLFVSLAQRLSFGDRLIVDEWNLGQFSSLFLYLPYKLFVGFSGSTDGIILFMRYFFLAFNAVFYWIMYARLRVYRWQALAAALLFSLYVPLLFFTCNHYTVPIRLLMIVCLLLFAEKQSSPSLLSAGVLLACAVLCQPGIALLYFGFTVLVWARFFRQKKGKRFLDDFAFCLHMRAWKYISISVFLCTAVFLCLLFVRGGLRNILTALPFLLNNPDLDFSAQGDMKLVFFRKFGEAIDVYGLVCLIPAFIIVVLSIAYACGLFRKRRDSVRKILFTAACAVWMMSCVQTFRVFTGSIADVFFTAYPVPMLWLGLVCYLLCAKKNKRFLLFWVAALASSLCIDVSSHTTLSLGSPIAYIANLIFFTDLVLELRAEQLPKKRESVHSIRDLKREKRLNPVVRWCTRLTCGGFAVWIAFVLLTGSTVFAECYSIGAMPTALQYTCERGPWRSLHISPFIGEEYERHLTDIDTIKEKQPKNLYVCGSAPELYLYANLPCAASSPWGWRQSSFLDMQVRYWKLHPDRLPMYIYATFLDADNPVNDDELSEEGILSWIHKSFDPLCDYTVETGQGGFILHVSQWHPDAQAAE